MLLRTHTSPNQIRVMERMQPPIRVIVPGKCYRYEATDATHEWMLTQVEGLAVDEGVRLSDLKGTLYEFARRLFGEDRRIIFHHSYFPFVEPGIEMAIDCFICRGSGAECGTCHGTGWIEILGGGMVHPEILENMRLRFQPLHGLRLRHGCRAGCPPPLGNRRHPPLLSERPRLPQAVLDAKEPHHPWYGSSSCSAAASCRADVRVR